MIINEVFKRPIISFGLGMTMLSCEVGDDVTVWQNEIYNEDQYLLLENENAEVITMSYITFASPGTTFFAEFNIVGIYNTRRYYENTTDFAVPIFIFWNGTRWEIVSELDVSDGSYSSLLGFLNQNIIRPISDDWLDGGSFLLTIPRTTTSNITVQGFTFTAVESKSIQIEVRQKGKATPLKSNTIQLIVT